MKKEEEEGRLFREASKVLKLMLEADSDVNLKESMEPLPASWLRLVWSDVVYSAS